MRHIPTQPPPRTLNPLVAGVAALLLSVWASHAVPYASCITNNGAQYTYYLNESADDVKIIFDGGGPGKTNALGAQAKGPHVFDMTGHSSFRIQVAKAAQPVWTLTSDDSNPMCMYGLCRGVAVSQLPNNLASFGRIYVSDAASPGAVTAAIQDAATLHWRTNYGKGIFVLNADQSDCLGQAITVNLTNTIVTTRSNGISFGLTSPSTSSPYHLTFAPDNRLYVNCFGTVDATTWRSTDADCSNFELVLEGVGEAANTTVHTDSANHPIVKGSLATGDLQLWNLEGNYSGHFNGIAQWDIMSGPLPWNTPPTFVGTATAYGSVADVTDDLELGLDGKWFVLVNRSAGTDRSSLQEYDTDGTTLLWDSFTQYGVTTSNPDPLRQSRSCALSPDGKTLAIVKDDCSIWLLSLTNGVLDQSTLVVVTNPVTASVSNPTSTANLGRQICWDAAGNLYTVSAGTTTTPGSMRRLRVFSPGGFTVTTIGSDGSFTLSKPTTSVSVLATTALCSQDTTQPPGVFTITRAGDTAASLAVGYRLAGTATNGVQYQTLSGTAIIPAGAAATTVNVVAIPQSAAGPVRSVMLTLNPSNSYSPTAPMTAEVDIADNHTPAIQVALNNAQFYERTNDLARFTLTRWGNTNVDVAAVNITYGGTAAWGTQFDGPSTVYLPLGAVTQDFSITPIHDGLATGPLTVTATVAPTSDGTYTVGTPATSAGITRVDADDAPETVLWSDNLQTDTSANWTQFFAAAPDPTEDKIVYWAYDYTGVGAPPAPHSGADTHGLFMTVNKNDSVAAGAALNFYPTGKRFSGNYAFRFDMFLIENNNTGTTEYALFGINHSGTKTNWFRNTTTTFTGVDATGWNFDGIFYDVESDGADLGQYVGYSSPTTANHNPTAITPGVTAEAMQGVFKSPPWTAGAAGGGAPANVYGSTTPIWADVEIKQVDGVIYWSINHSLLFAYTNTTAYTSGNVMLGYADAYDSIGGSGGSVVYANARVVSLARPVITQFRLVGSNVEITFTASSGDVVGQFALQSAGALNGGFADTSATISSLGGGVFKAVKAAGPGAQFYRIKRLE